MGTHGSTRIHLCVSHTCLRSSALSCECVGTVMGTSTGTDAGACAGTGVAFRLVVHVANACTSMLVYRKCYVNGVFTFHSCFRQCTMHALLWFCKHHTLYTRYALSTCLYLFLSVCMSVCMHAYMHVCMHVRMACTHCSYSTHVGSYPGTYRVRFPGRYHGDLTGRRPCESQG